MHINKNTFFREATLRICSSLDLQVALERCFAYITQYIPADYMVVGLISHEIGGLKFLAYASKDGIQRSGQLIHLPKETIDLAQSNKLPDLIIVDKPEDHPIGKYAARYFKLKDCSIITVRLVLEGKFIGGMTLLKRGRGQYSRKYAELVAPLREPVAIAMSNTLHYKELLHLKEQLADDNRYLWEELNSSRDEGIIGADYGLKNVMELIRKVARLNSPVLLLGDTGTGKEVLANAISNLSDRRDGPLVKVNCGAIPESLIDSELFGHEKGAFTGALARKRGRFERAHGGTIFLDEVGELPLEVQVRLLRVLQEKEIERIGGSETIPIDIRIIAATNRDLASMTREGGFREDLFFRLQVFPIHIPPLRERLCDIPALVQHFLLKKARQLKLTAIPTLAVGAMERLMAYHWPGNIRELENVVERALIISNGEPLSFRQFIGAAEIRHQPPVPVDDSTFSLNLNQIMIRHISHVLKLTDGKVEGKGGAAELLEINPATLRNRMRKLGIPFGRSAKVP